MSKSRDILKACHELSKNILQILRDFKANRDLSEFLYNVESCESVFAQLQADKDAQLPMYEMGRIQTALESYETVLKEMKNSGTFSRFVSNRRLRKKLEEINVTLHKRSKELLDALNDLIPDGHSVAPSTVDSTQYETGYNDMSETWEQEFGANCFMVPWQDFVKNVVKTAHSDMTAAEEELLRNIVDASNTGMVNKFKYVEFLKGFGPLRDSVRNMKVRFRVSEDSYYAMACVMKKKDAEGNHTILHVLVRAEPGGGFTVRDNKRANKVFRTLPELVAFYSHIFKRPLDYALTNQPWFHGDLSSDEAAQLLAGRQLNTFLIRFSGNTKGWYAMSWLDAEQSISHVRFEKRAEGYVVQGESDVFQSMEELIATYGDFLKYPLEHSQSKINELIVKHIRPQVQAEQAQQAQQGGAAATGAAAGGGGSGKPGVVQRRKSQQDNMRRRFEALAGQASPVLERNNSGRRGSSDGADNSLIQAADLNANAQKWRSFDDDDDMIAALRGSSGSALDSPRRIASPPMSPKVLPRIKSLQAPQSSSLSSPSLVASDADDATGGEAQADNAPVAEYHGLVAAAPERTSVTSQSQPQIPPQSPYKRSPASTVTATDYGDFTPVSMGVMGGGSAESLDPLALLAGLRIEPRAEGDAPAETNARGDYASISNVLPNYTEVPNYGGLPTEMAGTDELKYVELAPEDGAEPPTSSTVPRGTSTGSSFSSALYRLLTEVLVESERTFVSDLDVLTQMYFNPIRGRGMISREDFGVLFCNIPGILRLHREALDTMETVLSGGADVPDIQKCVAPILHGMHLYTSYCSNLGQMARVMDRLVRDNKIAFRVFVEQQSMTAPQCKNQSLFVFLLKPLQRLYAYPHVVQKLRDRLAAIPHAEAHAQCEALKQAVVQFHEAAMHGNECHQRATAIQTLLDLQHAITNLPTQLVLAVDGRGLIDVIEVASIGAVKGGAATSGMQSSRLIVCNDLVLGVRIDTSGSLNYVFHYDRSRPLYIKESSDRIELGLAKKTMQTRIVVKATDAKQRVLTRIRSVMNLGK